MESDQFLELLRQKAQVLRAQIWPASGPADLADAIRAQLAERS
jgi:hypothetical protein